MIQLPRAQCKANVIKHVSFSFDWKCTGIWYSCKPAFIPEHASGHETDAKLLTNNTNNNHPGATLNAELKDAIISRSVMIDLIASKYYFYVFTAHRLLAVMVAG